MSLICQVTSVAVNTSEQNGHASNDTENELLLCEEKQAKTIENGDDANVNEQESANQDELSGTILNHCSAEQRCSAENALKDPPKQTWLLRLFESKLFDMSIAITYLYNSKETGKYLMNL